MKVLYVILGIVFLTQGACGGGGTNVLNGLVSTTVASDVGEDLSTEKADAESLQKIEQSAVQDDAQRFARMTTFVSLVTASVRATALVYFIEDRCIDFEGRHLDGPRFESRPQDVVIPGPFQVSLTNGSVTPEIPDVEIALGKEICRARMVPVRPEPGEPPPFELRARVSGCPDAEVRLDGPPELEFDTDSIIVDNETVEIELEFPVSSWLDEIDRVIEDRRLDCDNLVIRPDRNRDAHDDINTNLPREGQARRR